MFVFSLIVLLAINSVFAGIFFSELNSKYNLGDTIDLNARVDPVFGDRLLRVTLFCEGNPVIEFNNFPDEEGSVNIKLPLNFNTIEQASGNCYFLGKYSGESRQSNGFEISKRLLVKLSKESFFTNPGEEIIISGTATRLNGNPINGEVEIAIPLLSFLQIELTDETVQNNIQSNNTTNNEDNNENFTNNELADNNNTNETTSAQETTQQPPSPINFEAGKFYGKVVNGEFSVNLKLKEETPAGNYRVDMLVFEKSDDGMKTSEGVAVGSLNVFHVLKSIELSLNNQNFDPGVFLEAKPNLLDQTGVNIEGEVSVIIRDETSKRAFEKIISSKEIFQYKIPANLTSGYYEIEASSSGISNVKKFFVNEKAIASFKLVNNSLIVTNIGNIPYRKDIEVELNGKPFIKKVSLNLGESQKFKLSGAGEYNVKISDGETEMLQDGVILTGYAVNVNAVNEKGFGFNIPIVWILGAVILAIGLLFLFRNIFKKKSLAYHFGENELELDRTDKIQIGKSSIPPIRQSELEKFTGWRVQEPIRQADQSVVLKGHRSNAAVLVLKIKNKIGRTEKQTIEQAIEYVYDKNGAVYEQENFVFVVFSPLMTRTNKNEVEAVKAAEKVTSILNDYNRKFRDKIEFGVGINSGDIINRIENKKLKFSALGNFIVVAKRLAGISDKQTLVTKKAYERGISEIKAEKIKFNGGEVYEVKGVVDHEKNKEFIKGFLNRQNQEED